MVPPRRIVYLDVEPKVVDSPSMPLVHVTQQARELDQFQSASGTVIRVAPTLGVYPTIQLVGCRSIDNGIAVAPRPVQFPPRILMVLELLETMEYRYLGRRSPRAVHVPCVPKCNTIPDRDRF